MKATHVHPGSFIFGGLFAVIAESLGRKPAVCASNAAQPAGSAKERSGGPQAPVVRAPAQRSGWRQRLGLWFWNRQMRGVDVQIARSRELFESLDQWLWKQQLRETEAYLAQSRDVFELEERIRRLERGPEGRPGLLV
jgi:hypothetical protein